MRKCRGDTSTTSTPGRATVAVWNADSLVNGLRRWKQTSRTALMRIAPGQGWRRRPAEFGRFDSIPASTGRCSGNTSPTRGCLPGLSRLTRRSRVRDPRDGTTGAVPLRVRMGIPYRTVRDADAAMRAAAAGVRLPLPNRPEVTTNEPESPWPTVASGRPPHPARRP